MNDLSWSFSQIWNQSLENREERTLSPREKIWASELGGSFIDRYLKMRADPPTNPPNPRSLRKFEAGNMMEWLVGIVLKRAGILKENQKWLMYQYPDLLPVSGKFDYSAGGKPDWSKAAESVKVLELPQFFSRATDAIIEHFSKNYPDGLKEVILEIKSCSSFMMEKYEKCGASLNHKLQLFHYLKATEQDEGHLVYISKDDLRMLEFYVGNPSQIEDVYKQDISDMTAYLKMEFEPKKEDVILFDKEDFSFSGNWKVAYSNYLTKLYGYKNQMEYE